MLRINSASIFEYAQKPLLLSKTRKKTMIRLLLLLTPSSSRHESGHEICPPRMVALSEVLWTTKENIGQEDFMDRLSGAASALSAIVTITHSSKQFLLRKALYDDLIFVLACYLIVAKNKIYIFRMMARPSTLPFLIYKFTRGQLLPCVNLCLWLAGSSMMDCLVAFRIMVNSSSMSMTSISAVCRLRTSST